jgi:hypothetical protein
MKDNSFIFNDEQRRVALNLAQFYDAWMASRRNLDAMKYGYAWKKVSGREYLYRVLDRTGNAKSEGARSPATENTYARFQETKAAEQAREAGARTQIQIASAIYRRLKMPVISTQAARILREADARSMLGATLMVIGTNAMAAYELEAGAFVARGLAGTEDFDLAWTGGTALGLLSPAESPQQNSVLGMLKSVDSTYTVNVERTFQARNAAAYEIELCIAPSRAAGYPASERLRPIPMAEQETLLLGQAVDHVVCGLDGSPARIVAPDPRYFALHKLWLSGQAKRTPGKRPKDAAQGKALLDSVARHMPQYPLDGAFAAALPDDLQPLYAAWQLSRPPASDPAW